MNIKQNKKEDFIAEDGLYSSASNSLFIYLWDRGDSNLVPLLAFRDQTYLKC
ncbi:hypothetical protein ACE6H2_001422 [Prunus campanulata]